MLRVAQGKQRNGGVEPRSVVDASLTPSAASPSCCPGTWPTRLSPSLRLPENHYDLPRVAEDFVHRVGRTGRAASRGMASTFAAPSEAHALKKIQRTLAINTRKYRVRPNSGTVRQAAPSFAAS